MDFTRALMFPFEDEEWLKKLGIGVLVGLIPIIGQMTQQGWSFEITKRVRRGDPAPLPDWSDFGGLLGTGFKLFVAALIYQIPTLIFACIASFVWLLPALGGDSDTAGASAGPAGPLMICCSCVIALYAIFAAIVYWGGVIRFVDREELATFFQVGENFALVRNNIGDFGMALLYAILAGVIASVVSSVTFGLGSLLTPIFMMYFIGHILGQLATKVSGAAAMPAV